MMSIRDTKGVLQRSSRTKDSALPLHPEARKVLRDRNDQVRVCNVETHLFRVRDDEGALRLLYDGTSEDEALEATLVKKDPETRNEIPRSGYSQNSCVYVRTQGHVEGQHCNTGEYRIQLLPESRTAPVRDPLTRHHLSSTLEVAASPQRLRIRG